MQKKRQERGLGAKWTQKQKCQRERGEMESNGRMWDRGVKKDRVNWLYCGIFLK